MGTDRHLCPQWGEEYEGPGAMSRADSSVSICPRCSIREALGAAEAHRQGKSREASQ